MPVGETIAVLASIIAIIQISERIIDVCKFYIQAASDTPSDLRAILIEISTLKSVLEGLQFLETCDHATPALWTHSSGQDGPIEECRRLIAKLEKLFPAEETPVAGNQSGSKKRKVQLALTGLAWPLKAHRARELLQSIIQQKTMINLALTTESTQDIKTIKRDTKEIHVILTENQRQDVYRWIEETDPSPIHNRAWKQHEPETSKWILRSPEWTKWLSGNARCIWIHGIPGAGKTILTSFLIEQIKKHCKNRQRSGHAYYYCYFGHKQEEAAPFLRWIIAQLCRQTEFIPDRVHKLYRQGGQPSLTKLLRALKEVLQSFDIAYVILDAVDESKTRDDLLKVLRDLATDAGFSNLCCLITSRECVDIEQTLEPISHSIPMSNPLVEDDIRKYIHSILHSSSKFQRWPVDLLDEVEDAVVKGSKGMFRWAVCQLDCLQRLKCQRHIIRNALKTLPKTLDETYERIFLDIPKDEWPFSHHALQWICFHQDMYQEKHPMSMKILLAATEKSTCNENVQETDLECDAERLRNILGCLINVNENDHVSLAHYTVREYLESSRISETATSYFRIGQEETAKAYLRILLREAQDVDWSGEQDNLLGYCCPCYAPDLFVQNFTVYCVVSGSMSLYKWQKVIASEESIFTLAIDFVNPSLDHFEGITRVCTSFEKQWYFFSELYGYPDYEYYDLSWIEQPKSNNAWILLHLLFLPGHSSFPVLADKFGQGKEVAKLAQSKMAFRKDVLVVHPRNIEGDYLFSGSLLQIMAQLAATYGRSFRWLLGHCETSIDSELLLSFVGFHFANHNYTLYNGGREEYCILKKILSGQADPNAKRYRVTPLQIAVTTLDVEGVRMLLEAGAEPNATGDVDGISFHARSILDRFNDLHGVSPLFICRKALTHHGPSMTPNEFWNSLIEMEDLLLQYEAREFSLFGSGYASS